MFKTRLHTGFYQTIENKLEQTLWHIINYERKAKYGNNQELKLIIGIETSGDPMKLAGHLNICSATIAVSTEMTFLQANINHNEITTQQILSTSPHTMLTLSPICKKRYTRHH